MTTRSRFIGGGGRRSGYRGRGGISTGAQDGQRVPESNGRRRGKDLERAEAKDRSWQPA